jgi:outer membrane protein assembly factor BamE (lipoprotein component of BamABCDE complex)
MKTITFHIRVVLLLIIISFVAGCMSHQYGTKLDSSKVSQIKKGVTTRVEVEALLGTPTQVFMIGEGRRTMSYSYTETSVHANAASYIPVAGMFLGGATGESQTQTLQIMISKSGVVEDYEFSDNAQNIESSGGLVAPSINLTPAPK